jgi:hypothetical protein
MLQRWPAEHRSLAPKLARLVVLIVAPLLASTAARADVAPWQVVRERDGITVSTRPVEGSGVLEFEGKALVAAPVHAIRAILRDVDHFEDWFPNTSESRLIAREANVVYQYTVIDTPWPITDRDNIFRSVTERDAETGVVSISISADPDRQPEQPERFRVRQARGLWLLEPLSPDQTRVTFRMHLEPGGGVPQWLVNAQVVETPFGALRNLRALLAKH